MESVYAHVGYAQSSRRDGYLELMLYFRLPLNPTSPFNETITNDRRHSRLTFFPNLYTSGL